MKTKAKKKPAPKSADSKTIVSFLLDETQSMGKIMGQTLEGFNTYISELREGSKDEVYFSLVTFSSRRTRKVYVGAGLNEVAELTPKDYQPGGYTPLVDAAMKTILATDEVLKQHPGAKVLVVIQTDGEENDSSEYTSHQLREAISRKEEEGWRFTFIGAGIDSYAQASQLGFHSSNIGSYGMDRGATKAMFASAASASVNYSNSMAGSAERVLGASFTVADKMGFADQFYSGSADDLDKKTRLAKAKIDITKKPADAVS